MPIPAGPSISAARERPADQAVEQRGQGLQLALALDQVHQLTMLGLSTVSPRPMNSSLTIAGGKRPWAATPGSASSRAASSAGSPIGPR